MENVDRQTDGQKSMFFLYYIDVQKDVTRLKYQLYLVCALLNSIIDLY